MLDVTNEPIDSIKLLTGNPRRGDLDAVKRSLEAFGQQKPIVVSRITGEVIAGNHALQAARALGWETIAVAWSDLTPEQAKAYAAADNRTHDLGTYDDELLAALLADIDDRDLLAATGFDDDDLAKLLGAGAPVVQRLTDADDIPDAAPARVKLGELWRLGDHYLLCGDCTRPDDIARVMGGSIATLIHADPPYGMGKEADGILNDNLYADKLDEFQQAWVEATLAHAKDNASLYIWGNAEDLWRLWWRRLSTVDRLTFRNEIVWDKGTGMGMRSDGHHMYATATERALFIMRGQQFLGNQNAEDYWEGHEPLRLHLITEVENAGWSRADVNRITGKQMAGHWLGRSQFMVIDEGNYNTLRDAADGRAFTTPYGELFAQLFPELRDGSNAHRRSLSAQLRSNRTTFNNTHDAMTDVWAANRVQGADRHGHATPKPVAFAERAILTSTNPGDHILVPFGGTAPELIAAEHHGRTAHITELEPRYCDTIITRWEQHTGKKATQA